MGGGMMDMTRMRYLKGGQYFSVVKVLKENGFRKSQYQLSKMFFNGWGIKKDIVKSFMWANISASQGYEKAIIKRDNLITMLSNTEVQKAQKLSLDCFSKKFKNC